MYEEENLLNPGEQSEQGEEITPGMAVTVNDFIPTVGQQGIGYKWEVINSATGIWQGVRDRIAQNHAFAQGVQWDDEQIKDHLAQGRNPVSYNIVGPMLRALFGKFQGMKKQWIVYPRTNPEDDGGISQLRAEALAFAMNSVAQESDWDASGSLLVAQDSCCGLGWATCYKDEISDGTPIFKLERVDWHEIIFDTRARKPDLSDAYWLARQQMRTIPEAIALYAMHEGGIAPDGRTDEEIANIITGARGLQSTQFPLTNFFNQGNATFYDSYEIPIVEYYERRRFNIFVLVDESPDAVDPAREFATAEEANQEMQQKLMDWQNAALMQIQSGVDPSTILPPPTLSVKPRNVPRIVQTCFVNQSLLSEIVIESDSFPYVPFFQFFDSGADELAFWGFVDVVKEPQQFMNRTLSMMDLILGGAQKNVMEVDLSAMAEGQTPEQLELEVGKANPMLYVKDGMLGQAMKVHPTTQFPPGYTEMLQIIRSLLDQTFPSQAYGQALPGAQGGVADPSGRAIALQSAVADNTTAIIFSSYAYGRRLLGELLAFFLQNDMDGPMTFQLLGPQKGMQWKTLNNGGIGDTIIDLKFTVNVTDEDYSESSQMNTYNQLTQFTQDQAVMETLMNVAPGAWLEIIKAKIQCMKIPEELKMKIMSAFAMQPPVLAAPPQGGSTPSAPAKQSPGQLLQPTADEHAGTLIN